LATALPDSPAQPSASKPSTPSPASAPGTRKPTKIVALQSATREAPAGTDDELPDTEKARAAYNSGNQALFQGNSDAAIQAYRQALSAAPTFPAGFRGLGLAYAQKGQSGLAIMSLRTYLAKAPHARDAALIKQRIAALMASDH
jgi:tetratricopeptide (TPR) repeat protein